MLQLTRGPSDLDMVESWFIGGRDGQEDVSCFKGKRIVVAGVRKSRQSSFVIFLVSFFGIHGTGIHLSEGLINIWHFIVGEGCGIAIFGHYGKF